MIAKSTYALALGLVMTGAGACAAVSLADCMRTTHISHGGEDMHRDLGEGRVMWRDWWSHEATASTYVIVDCAEGRALRFLTAAENLSDEPPFDRTEAALKIVERHESGARVFATLERMAADLEDEARKISIETLSTEPCACAALYADARDYREAFQLDG